MANEFGYKRYSGKEYAYGTLPNKYFNQQIDKFKPGKLLLPGEGKGRKAGYAAKMGWKVTAIDQSIIGKKKH
jgi:hypothetical protein